MRIRLFSQQNFVGLLCTVFLNMHAMEVQLHNDVNAKDKYEEAVLFDAVRSNDSGLVKKLIECKVNLNIQDNDGRTVLHLAAYRGNTDAVKLFLQKGAHVNIKNTEGATVLQFCIKLIRPYPLTLLLAKASYKESLNNFKEQALILLCMRKYFNKISVLKQIDKRIFLNGIFPYLWDNPLSNRTELKFLQQRVEREKQEGKTEENSQWQELVTIAQETNPIKALTQFSGISPDDLKK
jgi:ankyrin repeat protein